jgi:prepilin-type N-terminal cleavage/methylation domain-containing protein
MMLRNLKRIFNSQRGFTLIEIMVSVVIVGMIGFGVSAATSQIMKQSVRNRDFTTASQFTMNAIHWISRDAEMAQTIQMGEDSGFPLTLTWVDWGITVYTSVYTIENGTLTRTYSVTGGPSVQSVLAQSLVTGAEETTCEYGNKTLALRITATVGNGDTGSTVSNTHEIYMRSMP